MLRLSVFSLRCLFKTSRRDALSQNGNGHSWYSAAPPTNSCIHPSGGIVGELWECEPFRYQHYLVHRQFRRCLYIPSWHDHIWQGLIVQPQRIAHVKPKDQSSRNPLIENVKSLDSQVQKSCIPMDWRDTSPSGSKCSKQECVLDLCQNFGASE